MAGRPPAVGDREIVRAVDRALSESGDPAATTKEVAARLSIGREGTGRRLNELASAGRVERKQVGGSYIWWLPEGTDGRE